MKKVLLEGLIVAVIGAAIAFGGNALSPRGISLTRDFFHASKSPAPAASSQPLPTNTVTAATTNSALEELAARLKAQGLALVNGDQVLELFNDSRRAQNLIVFIDARNDTHYQAGHIPGAYQFDYFHPEKYLAAVVPAVQPAEQVIVYCEGGKCEDSMHAALMLGDLTPKQKLMVYGGGITEWMSKGLEIESGERNSGILRKGP